MRVTRQAEAWRVKFEAGSAVKIKKAKKLINL